MSAATPTNVAASVRARLLNVAKAQGVDFNQVLMRFALGRILYRLTQSPHADRFLLKCALLFTILGRFLSQRPRKVGENTIEAGV